MKLRDVLNRIAELIESEDIYNDIRPGFKNLNTGRIIVYIFADFKDLKTGDSVNLNLINFHIDMFEEVLVNVKTQELV